MATTQIQAQVDAKVAAGDKNYRGMKLPGASFKGADLRQADFRGASCPGADFTEADVTHATFAGANLVRTNWTDAICHRTNFKDAEMSGSLFYPKDCFGITVTLECKSFQGMKILPGWWFGWIFYALLMQPPSEEWEDKLIAFMGVERYAVLRQQYAQRQM